MTGGESRPQLVGARLVGGVWEGVIAGNATRPALRVTHLNQPVPDVSLTALPDGRGWHLRVPVPPAAIADGVQTLLVTDAGTGDLIADLTLVAGDALDHDIRAEIGLLRAELDLLKRAFRRHCVETA